MKLNRHLIAGATALTVAATGVFAASHNPSPEDRAVNARKAHMGLYAFNLGILGAMAKGEMDYNGDLAQALAGDLAALTKISQAAYWPQGTSNADREDTRALPALWTNIGDTMAKGKALAEAADALAASAGSLEGLQGAIGGVGKACGDCHKATRAPKN